MIDLVEDLKDGIKENPQTRKILENLVNEGLSEDVALDLMIYAWLQHDRWNDME